MGYLRPLSQTKFINDANLVSYWTLDGNSNDSKGSNNGTDTSISYSTANAVASNFGQGASLNGTTSNISTPDSALGIGSAFTFSFWIKTSAITEQGIYCRDTVGVLRAWQFRIDATTGVLRLVRFDSGGGLQTNFATSTAVNTGNYTHVVATWNTTSGAVLYINGKNSGTDSNVTAQNNNTGVTPKIGIGTGAAAIGPFNGTIDDGAVFSRALSAGEVAELYQSQTLGEYLGAGSGTTKLLLHLNGSSADSSGNNNNGTDTAITYSQANGKFGQGAGFNGSTSKIVMPNKVLTTGTDFTVSCWLKNGNTAQGQDCTVMSNQKDSTSGFFVSRSTAGTPNEYSFTYGNGSAYQGYGSGLFAISSTVFEYYTFVLSGSARKIYRNGLLIVSDTLSGNVSWTLADPLNFGINPPLTAGRYWNGSIDEVIVENVAWSADKVKKDYTYSKGIYGII